MYKNDTILNIKSSRKIKLHTKNYCMISLMDFEKL